MKTDAGFSPCRTWRYWLSRTWDETLPALVVIGLNPSTADETQDDPTIRKCIKFAKTWGFGGLVMLNLYAYRSTDPKGLKKAKDPVGPANDATILERTEGRQVLCAWGTHGTYLNRDLKVKRMLAGRNLVCLKQTKDGHPQHPLYLKDSTQPISYWIKQATP
jgi:hypothetical protein